MDEFDFIKRIKPKRLHHKRVKVGIGDDAAVYEAESNKQQVVCVDTMVEGVHFLKSKSSPRDIGYKALAVNISDIAAMGAVPLYYLVAISIPDSWNETELTDIFNGMNELAEKVQIDLLGGDTVATSGNLVITVTAIGEVESHVKLLRSEARDGDIVFVTGTVGDSAAGLAQLLEEISIKDTYIKEYLIKRHKRPNPQVKAGRIIAKLDRASLNDVSDGLASELHELSEASRVGMIIDKHAIPISNELAFIAKEYDISKWVFYGGEDYELVGTTSPESWEKLKGICNQSDINLTKIGYVSKNHIGVHLKADNQQLIPLNKSGYNHFKE